MAVHWGSENGWTAVKCRQCGLVYVDPRPSAAETDAANIMGQHRTETGKLDVVFHYDQRKLVLYRRRLARLYADLPTNGRPLRWLDVGAGFGETMEVLRHILPNGSIIEGIEPMLAKADNARARGLKMLSHTLAESEKAYDVISLINVFSHLPDPRSFLNEVRQHLLPDGEVLIETGNGGDLSAAQEFLGPLYLPDHLVFAGESHMERFLEESGFKLLVKRRFRTDTPRLATHWLLQRARGQSAKLRLPYTSAFRTIFYRARLC